MRKGQRRLDGIDKIVIGLYAKGMRARDIQRPPGRDLDVDVRPDLISKITDAVHAEVAEWRVRPLDGVYPVIFLDALSLQGPRRAAPCATRPRAWPSGVDSEDRKEVLGIWVKITEGAQFLLGDQRTRGPRRPRRARSPSATGLTASGAIEAV